MVGIEHLRHLEIVQCTRIKLPERLHQTRCLRIANQCRILAVNFGKFETRTLRISEVGSLL